MTIVNRIMTPLFEVLLGPFSDWPPLLTLVLWSAVIGVLMAVMFRFTSNQRAMRSVVDQIKASLLAIKLFQHDLGVTFQCQLSLFRAIGLRLWYSLPPLLAMIIPVVLLLAQFGLRFERMPLTAGESVVVEVQLSSEQAWEQYSNVPIQAPSVVTVETEALHDRQLRTIYWRLAPQDGRSFVLQWQMGDYVIEKDIAVTDRPGQLVAVSSRRPGRDWFDQIIHPGEASYPADAPVASVDVHYVPRATRVLGYDVPWWLTFLIVSCLSAYLVRPLVKVQF